MNLSVAVLPEGVVLSGPSSSKTRFLRLPHPRTGSPALYLPATRKVSKENVRDEEELQDEDILLEVQAINATGDRQRSWFADKDTVVIDGKLLLLTQMDPVFLLIRILMVVGGQTNSSARRSLPYDDIFDSAAHLFHSHWNQAASSTASPSVSSSTLPETPRTRAKRQRIDVEGASDVPQAAEIQQEKLRVLCQDLNAFGRLSCTKRAIQRISEEKVITQDMSAYSADDDKILAVCRSKIEAMATRELFAKSATLTRMLGKEGVGDGEGIPEDVHREARQKASLDVLSNYLPKETSTLLRLSYSFPNLAAYLERNSASSVLSVDYMPGISSTPSLSTTSSLSSISGESTFRMRRKGSGGEGSFDKSSSKTFGNDAKKATAKKSMESNGVRQLKKASTRGMSPLTSFFAKKSPTPGST